MSLSYLLTLSTTTTAVLALVAYYFYAKKPVAQLRKEGVQNRENLAVLRAVDKLILSNLSLPYIAQEIVNLLGQKQRMLGAAVTTIDERTGALTIQAITRLTKIAPLDKVIKQFTGMTVAPEEMQRNASRFAQAINERRVIAGDDLVEFTCPPLKPSQARKIQQLGRIKHIVVYPVVAGDRVSGAMIYLFNRSSDSIDAKDTELMEAVTSEVGIALENARLISQIEAINKKLQAANQHLQQLDANKDEFISIASHQLRTPLTAIKGYVSMLLEGDFGPVRPEQATVMQQLEQSTNQIINMVNELLSVSRINAQKFELVKAPTRLEDLAVDVVAELRPLAKQKSLPVRLHLPAKSPGELMIDPMRIRQAILNFLDNALKYTTKGYVDVTLRQDGQDVVLTVTDTGIGIPKKDLEQMFTKFFRAKNARELLVTGSGLGLFVAKRVIDSHRGSCIMESQEGRGSTFGFRLPLAAVTVPRSKRPPSKTAATVVKKVAV